MNTISNRKLAIDLLISIVATVILSTAILSVSTNSWSIKHENSVTNRTGLFQTCSNTLCCDAKELDRTITFLSLLSIILLAIGTLSAFIFMASTINYQNRCYILVPLSLFGGGISMTLTLIQVLERLYPNGYSAWAFMIDTMLAYILGGVSLIHANMFYF